MLISFLFSIASSVVLALIFYRIGTISRDLKLSNLLIKMLEEDIEYLDSSKSSLTVEERETVLYRLDGKETVYKRLRKEFSR